MKNVWWRAALRALVVTTVGTILVGLPPAARSGVTGTPHDLNTFPGISVPGGEVCKPCHTPHFSQGTQTFLWNHTRNESITYTLYNATHASPYSANYVGMDTTSKLCLSCHDGAIAIDSFGGAGGSQFMPSDNVMGSGGNLSGEHPMGLTYPGLNADGTWSPAAAPGFNDPTSGSFSAGGASGPGIQLVPMPATTAKGIGCTSCHTPHDQTNGHFLRVPSNSGNSLCLKCHSM